MKIKSLRGYLEESKKSGKAIGHFNVSDILQINAVINASKKSDLPAIIGVSEGERNFLGIENIVSIVKNARKEGIKVFLNADHAKSFVAAKGAVLAGFDAVLFDAGKLGFEKNKKETKKFADFVKKFNKKNKKDILVEGELGYIGSGSVVRDKIPADADLSEEKMTSEKEIKEFVCETGVDLVAPAVGNMHGVLRVGKNPKLNTGRIKNLQKEQGAFLVLHGGSGIPDIDFKKAIKSGISVVHISSEFRIKWVKEIEKSMKKRNGEIAPYKILRKSEIELTKFIEERIKFFAGV